MKTPKSHLMDASLRERFEELMRLHDGKRIREDDEMSYTWQVETRYGLLTIPLMPLAKWVAREFANTYIPCRFENTQQNFIGLPDIEWLNRFSGKWNCHACQNGRFHFGESLSLFEYRLGQIATHTLTT